MADAITEEPPHERGTDTDPGEVDAATMLSAQVALLEPAVRRSFRTSLVSIAVFSSVLAPQAPMGLAVWIVLRAVFTLGVMALDDLRPAAKLSATKRIERIVVTSAASGLFWGTIPLFVRPEAPEWRAVVVLWLFGNQSVVTATTAPSAPVFRAGIGSVTIVGALSVLSAGDRFSVVLAGLLLLGGVYSLSIFDAVHRAVIGAIVGQIKTAELSAEMAVKRDELEAANERLRTASRRDDLTGLPNRRGFTENTADDDGIVRSDCWIGYVDLDHFKSVNDTLGHGAGDRLLRTVAERWAAVLPVDCILARTGGDEFTLVTPAYDRDRAVEIAERLRLALEEPIAVATDEETSISCSVGLSWAAEGQLLAAAMADADAALYEAKDRGRDTVVALRAVPGESYQEAPTAAPPA